MLKKKMGEIPPEKKWSLFVAFCQTALSAVWAVTAVITVAVVLVGRIVGDFGMVAVGTIVAVCVYLVTLVLVLCFTTAADGVRELYLFWQSERRG